MEFREDALLLLLLLLLLRYNSLVHRAQLNALRGLVRREGMFHLAETTHLGFFRQAEQGKEVD